MSTRRRTTGVPKKVRPSSPKARGVPAVVKVPTGIRGFDDLTGGGLPAGRPTLVCGGPGCGKSLFGLEFLVHGAETFGERGVFVTFEESPDDVAANVASLGHDMKRLQAGGKLVIEHIQIDRAEIEEAGAYDLEGLFVRLDVALSGGAKRIVLDTMETLFSSFRDLALLRTETQRLFRWLKERGVTAVVTGERGPDSLTRDGLEEYVSDCVVLLDQRVENQVTTRRLRIVKYRGSAHGMNEYPFLIEAEGICVLPITAINLDYPVSTKRVPSGVPALDEMLGGDGYYRASTILASGASGTGKSLLGAAFLDAACRRGERALMFALEESPSQVFRNTSGLGMELERWTREKLLQIHAARPTNYGLESHLVQMFRSIEGFDPGVVVIDPISSFLTTGSPNDVKSVLIRVFDYLKMRGITCLVTCLTGPVAFEETDLGVSSLIDTWLEVRDLESMGERNRGLYVIKSRGMKHSNQVREFRMGPRGMELLEVYSGLDGILTGSARVAAARRDTATERARREERARTHRALTQKRASVEAQIVALRAELSAAEADVTEGDVAAKEREDERAEDRDHMRKARGARSSLASPARAAPKGSRRTRR